MSLEMRLFCRRCGAVVRFVVLDGVDDVERAVVALRGFLGRGGRCGACEVRT